MGTQKRYWQVKSYERNNFDLLASRHCPTPFCERTYPEIPIVLRTNQVCTQIEEVVYGCVSPEKSLSLPDRLESRNVGPPHPPLSNPGRFMRLLSPIILILFSAMNDIWHEFSVGTL